MTYYYHLEESYQEDVEQNTFLVKLTNQKVYMKKKLFKQPFGCSTIESGNKLIDRMAEETKRRWKEFITYNNMPHNSRKPWKTIRKLSNDPTTSIPPCIVSVNEVANQILAMAEVTCHLRYVLPPATEAKKSTVKQ